MSCAPQSKLSTDASVAIGEIDNLLLEDEARIDAVSSSGDDHAANLPAA
jgi:hypothetical protein